MCCATLVQQEKRAAALLSSANCIKLTCNKEPKVKEKKKHGSSKATVISQQKEMLHPQTHETPVGLHMLPLFQITN